MDQFPGKLYPNLDPNSQSKLLENHILQSGTFPYSPYMAVPHPHPHPHPRPFIHSFHRDLSPSPLPPPPHTHTKFTYSCNHSLKFLLGITVIPRREIKDNGYQAKFWGVNKVHCGQHKKTELPTNVSCRDHFYLFRYRSNYIQVKLI